MSKGNKLSGQPVLCQLLSYIPDEIIQKAVTKFNADHYYKKMLTKNQLVFLLYGVITRSPSLRSLCKSLLFLENKLMYLGIDSLPAPTTLSDANINRDNQVFAEIYYLLYEHYRHYLSDSYLNLFINEEVDPENVKIFDATTISLFVDIFKAAGRNPVNGKRKGGLKVQCCLPLGSLVPELVHLTPSASNDRNFLGQLPLTPGTIYVFDLGYINYRVYQKWSEAGVYFVTKLANNASYQVIERVSYDVLEYASGGIIKEEVILLQSNAMEAPLKARLITYKDPLTGRIFQFVSNMFDFNASTIPVLYKNRWNIEPIFKKLKQNFELNYFYSDKQEGIKTQIWIALIANLLFEIIHKQTKEKEQYTTIVCMAAGNMGSYICLISLLTTRELEEEERNLKNIQLSLFEFKKGGTFEKTEKSP